MGDDALFREVRHLRATPTGLWLIAIGALGAVWSLVTLSQWRWAGVASSGLVLLVGALFEIEARVTPQAVIVRLAVGPLPVRRHHVPFDEIDHVDWVPADQAGGAFGGWGGSRRGLMGAYVESIEGPVNRLVGWRAVRIHRTDGSRLQFGCWRSKAAIDAINTARDRQHP